MKRPHIVLDTNVLVSASLFGGLPREILGLIVAGVIDCSLSLPILDELRNVLQRPKFGLSAQQALAIVEELSALCGIVVPSRRIRSLCADPDDDRILECALEARVDAIVSGDAHLLGLGMYEGIRIVSPSEFLQIIEKKVPAAKRKRKRGDNGM